MTVDADRGRNPVTTDNPLPISCYIRTLNEERRIGEVIGRAKLLCRQVVVVDSGSTDATVEIARNLGAEVVNQQWLGNGHQKRAGEAHCKYDWLLDLDADEVLSLELIDLIRAEFAGPGPNFDVYKLALTIVDPAGRVWHRSGVSYRAKLYNRHVAQMPAERAWDQLSLSPRVRVRRLPGPLLHHAFTDVGHLVRKQESAMRNRVTGMPPRSRVQVASRVVLGFPCYFLKYFLAKGLWRVGLYGFCFSFACAFSRWGRDVKLYERDWLSPESSSDAGGESSAVRGGAGTSLQDEERRAA